MELTPLTFITFEDVIRSGACPTGVIAACDRAAIFSGPPHEVIVHFPSEAKIILRAANLDGDGDGDGDGYGDGYGYGNGDGDGNGYGNGNGGIKTS